MLESDDNVIYSTTSKDVCQTLNSGCKIGLSYTVKASIKEKQKEGLKDNGKNSIWPITLGSLCTQWKPFGLPIEEDIFVDDEMKSKFDLNGIGRLHGPLPSNPLPSIQFCGPQCNVERTPFHAELLSFPHSPRVAVPFEFQYIIKNKTALNQKLVVSMADGTMSGNGGEPINGFIVSGLVNHEMELGPFESKILSYIGLAMRAGKTLRPALTVTSSRYKSWVINDDKYPRYSVILP